MMATEQYTEVFDMSLALSSVGGDQEFLTELVGLVQAAWPTLLADIRAGLARQDFWAVETTARLAKAAARYVAAGRAYESARELETSAGKGDLPAAQSATTDLEREVDVLRIFLATLGSKKCSP